MLVHSRAGCVRSANTLPKASKEGGFLGMGGVRVSDAEKATLRAKREHGTLTVVPTARL
jgi:hypothetical protein